MALNKGYLTAKTDKASDEVYTPAYAVKPIIKYITMRDYPMIIWCPFDMEYSKYVKPRLFRIFENDECWYRPNE